MSDIPPLIDPIRPRDILDWDRSLDLSAISQYRRANRYIEESNGRQLKAEVVVEESASDELMITEHPVQEGAVIADHAVKRPAEVRIRMGWSAAYLARNGEDGSLIAVYDRILRLQASRSPFIIYTGKRAYENMLVASIQTSTNASMEYSFMADISFREVVLVSTKGLGINRYAGSDIANPEHNAQSQQAGSKQSVEVTLNPGQPEQAIGEPYTPDYD